MMPDELAPKDRSRLLKLARLSLELCVNGKGCPEINLPEESPFLQQTGASFVTLMKNGQLRGCVGTIEAYQSLAEDVCEHAVAAALSDYRFPQVLPEELPDIQIEVSHLTPPQPLIYDTPEELLQRLCPGIDGVVIRDGNRRATFLPQVWEKLPDPAIFLNYLCQKMGAPPDQWRRKVLQVFIYRVEKFCE